MVRQLFRLGVRFGLIVGVVAAVVKVVQARRSMAPAGAGWDSSPAPWTPPAPAPTPPSAQPARSARPASQGSDGRPSLEVVPPLVTPAAPAAVTRPVKAARKPTSLSASPSRPASRPPSAAAAPPAPEPPPAAARVKKAAPAKKAAKKAPVAAWVEPTGMTCPPSHPIKAKLASRLFHLPGMFAYERTRPDRCYASEATAVTEGFIRAKR